MRVKLQNNNKDNKDDRSRVFRLTEIHNNGAWLELNKPVNRYQRDNCQFDFHAMFFRHSS